MANNFVAVETSIQRKCCYCTDTESYYIGAVIFGFFGNVYRRRRQVLSFPLYYL
jgi:hypothetical protein